MKKSVVLAVVISIVAFFWIFHTNTLLTGLQVLDLPEPPPPPGMSNDDGNGGDDTSADTGNDYAVYIPRRGDIQATPQQQVPIATPATGLEMRIKALEGKVDAMQDQSARIDRLQSEVDKLKVDVENANRYVQRPMVDQPASQGSLDQIKQSIARNLLLSISLIILFLLAIAGLITYLYVRNKRSRDVDKETIAEYIRNYTQQGYNKQTLIEHLQASGWDPKLIQEAQKDMWT